MWHDDVLTIVAHEPEIRNQTIVTLLWDLDARAHEITALRLRDIVLNKQVDGMEKASYQTWAVVP